jgi:hypothetical protein
VRPTVKLLFLLLILSAPLGAQQWTEVRSSSTFPAATPVVSTYVGCSVALTGSPPTCPLVADYTPYVVPAGNFSQQPMWYYPPAKGGIGCLADKYFGTGEWCNGLFFQNVALDNGSSTTGINTGWAAANLSLNIQQNGTGAVQGSGISSITQSGTTVTIVFVTASARSPIAGNIYLIQNSLVTGANSPSGAGNTVTYSGCGVGANPSYENLCTTITYTVGTSASACQNTGGTGSCSALVSGTTYVIGPAQTATQPYRMHTEGCALDTNRNWYWCGTGIGDVDSIPGQILLAHTGVYQLYHTYENDAPTTNCNANGITGQRCLYWVANCGFTTIGKYCQTPNTSQTVNTPTGNGIPCASNGQCGFKFPGMAFEPVCDCLIIIGGQFNSTIDNEILIYHISTDTWQNVTSPSGFHARWYQGDSRLPILGKFSHKILVFGGQYGGAPCASNCLNDTWVFDTIALTMTQVVGSSGCTTACAQPASPPPNLNPEMDWDEFLGKVVMVGNEGTATGTNTCNATTCAHVWFYDPVAVSWTDQTALAIAASTTAYSGSPALTQGTSPLNYNSTCYFNIATNQMVCNIRQGGAATSQVWTLNLPMPIGIQADEWPGGCTPGGGGNCASPTPILSATRPTNAVVSTIGWPVPDAYNVTCSGTLSYGCLTSQLSLFSTLSSNFGTVINAQFTCASLWLDNNCKWLWINTQAPTFTEGTLDGELALTQVTSGGGNLPSTPMGSVSAGVFTINTGAATFVVQQANNNLFQSVTVGSTALVTSGRTPKTFDGFVEMGPTHSDFALGTIFSVSCTNPPPMTTAASGTSDACTTPYTSANDSASTCSLLRNGGMYTELECDGNLINSNGDVYDQYHALYKFWKGHTDAEVSVALGNAQKYTQSSPYTSGDTQSAGKMLELWDARLTLDQLLNTGGHAVNFNGVTTTLVNFISDTASVFQGYSSQDLWVDYNNSPNCTTSGGSSVPEDCVTPAIARTGTTPHITTDYAIQGYEIQSSQSITGTTTGANYIGWAMENDAANNGVEFGINRMAQHWPDALEFYEGGMEIRIGIMPDQGIASGSPTVQSYVAPWTQYNFIKDLWFNFFAGAVPSNPGDLFTEYQQPLLGRMPYNTYNATLPIPIVNPVAEDLYYINLSPQPNFASGATSTNAGTLLADVGCTSSCFNQVSPPTTTLTTMYNFPKYIWEQGGPNQQDAAMATYYQWLQRGWNGTQMVLAGSQPGRYQWGWNFTRDQLSRGCIPRSDFANGWRNITWVSTVFSQWGYPSQLTTWNLGQRDWCDQVNGNDHLHWEGATNFYFLTGDYWLGTQLTQGLEDIALSTNSPYNNPAAIPGNGYAVPAAVRAAAHTLGVGSMEMQALCDTHNSAVYSSGACQTSALSPMVKVAGYNMLAPAFASGYSLPPYSVTEASNCQTRSQSGSAYPSTCSTGQGIRGPYLTGINSRGSADDCTGSTPPCVSGTDYHVAKAYQNQSAQFGLHLFDKTLCYFYGTCLYNTSETVLNDGNSTNISVSMPGPTIQQSILGSGYWALHEANVKGASAALSSMVYQTYLGYLNSTPPCSTANSDCSRTSGLGVFGGENYTHWGSIAAETNSIVDLSGSSIQQQWEYYIERIGQGAYSELYSPEMMFTDNFIINHNLANPNSYTLGPVPTLQDIQISQTTCVGTCTITWNVPVGLTSINGTSYRLTYSANQIVNWQQFYPNCGPSGYSEGTCPSASLITAAADGSGGWNLGQDPGSNVQSWFSTTPVNDPALQTANGSYTFTCPLASCNLDLKAYALSTVPICASGQVCLVPTAFNFGNIAVGIPSSAAGFTLYNETSASINIAPSVSGTNAPDFPFSIPGSGGCGSSLPAGASCIINDIFTPSLSAAETANLSVNYSVPSSGTVRVAASCATSDVQTQVTAAVDGDIVEIPNGTCSWTTGISTTKQIQIRAQNYTPTFQGLVSRNVVLTNNSTTVPLISMVSGNSFNIRISGIEFDEGTTPTVNHVSISGTGTMIPLMDDDTFQVANRFGNDPAIAAIAWEALGGVVWNSYIYGVGGGIGGQCCPEGASFYVNMQGVIPWASNSTLGVYDTGGGNNLYIEDSTWKNFGQSPDGDDGSRYVIRHSILDGIGPLTHGFTSTWGGRQYELYNDTIETTTSNRNEVGRYFYSRGGTGVEHDNAVTYQNQGYGTPVLWQGIVECPQNSGHSTCTTGQIPSNSTVIGSGPEAQRQTGTGWDSSAGGYHIDPVYLWNNCLSGHTIPCTGDSTWSSASGSFITINRDIFVDSGAKPEYTPYAYPHPARTGSGVVTSVLTGTGVSGGTVILSPSSYTYPTTANTCTSLTCPTQTFTLSNTTGSTVTGITITLLVGTYYAQAGGTCGSTLPASSSCTIIVQFLPSNSPPLTTLATDTLNVVDSASSSPQQAALAGHGVNPSSGFPPNPLFPRGVVF